MSSSRPRRRRRAFSLRARLLVTLLLVVAALCTTIGVATEVALHRYLITKTDKDLKFAADRALNGNGPWQPGGPRPKPGGARGLPPGTLTATLDGGYTEGSVIPRERGDDVPLPDAAYPVLEAVPTDGA